MIKEIITGVVVTGVCALSFGGWKAANVINAKLDRTEFTSEKKQVVIRVADALDERDYQRYEEKIEEAQQEIMNIRYEDPTLTPRDQEKIEQLEQRVEKYKTRQGRIK